MLVYAGSVNAAGVLLLSGLLACALAEQVSDGWVWHTARHSEFTYRVEYPVDWQIEKEAVATHFRAPEAHSGSTGITVVVINELQTPPLPVFVTYTTVRVIEAEGRSIEVQQRDPSATTEQYLVRLQHGPFTTEFRFIGSATDALDNNYKSVFDHMVLSYSLSPNP